MLAQFQICCANSQAAMLVPLRRIYQQRREITVQKRCDCKGIQGKYQDSQFSIELYLQVSNLYINLD